MERIEDTRPRAVGIVGAGISGLALAFRLGQLLPAASITILEKTTRPGGTVRTERLDGFQVECGPNGFLDTKPATLELCRDLGIAQRLIPASAAAAKNRYVFLDNQLKLLPGSLSSFLASDLLSGRGKLQFVLERFRRRRTSPEDESVDAFARRRAGPEAADVFADALVTGIYAGDPKLLSLAASFPRLATMESQYGSLLKGFRQLARDRGRQTRETGQSPRRPGRMWSFPEGLEALVETLAQPVPPILGVAIQRIIRDASSPPKHPRWILTGDGQDQWSADAVILACPAYQQAALVADWDKELAERIGGIAYNRVAVVALGYRRQDIPRDVNGFGYISPQRTRRDVLGVQWCSSIFPGRAPEGLVLLRAMCGGWNRPEVAGWDDARLLAAVQVELQLAMGIEAKPCFHSVIRWDRAIPQYHLGHLDRVAWIENRVRSYPGLFVAGNAYHGVALNDCTEQGMVVAEKVFRYLASAN